MSSQISGRWRSNVRNPFFYAAMLGMGCAGIAGMMLAGASAAEILALFGPVLVLVWVTMPFLLPPPPAGIDHRLARLAILAGAGVVPLVVVILLTQV